MNRNIILKNEIMISVKKYLWTIIAVNIKGEILNYVSLQAIPNDLDEFKKLILHGRHKGCVISFIYKDRKITERKIDKRISESVKEIKYFKTHKLKPGINLPEQD